MNLEPKAMPGTPMSKEEMERQCAVVSEAASALDYFTEEEIKHTLGPWAIGYGGMEGDTFATITSAFSKFPICQLEPNGYNPANARLIAAAPALLAAAEAVIKDRDSIR